MRASIPQILDHLDQAREGACKPIEPDHDQGFAGADLVQQPRQLRAAAAIGAGGVLFEDRGAAGCTQFVQLRIGALVRR